MQSKNKSNQENSTSMTNESFILEFWYYQCTVIRCSPSEVFLGKGVPKICSKFTGEHRRRSVISMKLQSSY